MKISKQILKKKRGVSPYLSWILLMAFVVAISAFMYSFMTDYTKDTTTDIKKQVYDTDECRSLSLNIKTACISSQTLNITLQNTGYIRIEGIDYRLYDANNIPLHTNRTNSSMNPNRIKPYSINLGVSDVGLVEVIPVIRKDNIEIICSEKKAQKEVLACS